MAEPVPGPTAGPPNDPLAALRSHVRDAQLAAERIAREATARRAGAGPTESADASASTEAGRDGFADPEEQGPGTPPSGWDASAADEQTHAELRALIELLESLRAMLPDELREQLNDLIRQILLLLRALIDWLVLRMERETAPRSGSEPIEDIPIS